MIRNKTKDKMELIDVEAVCEDVVKYCEANNIKVDYEEDYIEINSVDEAHRYTLHVREWDLFIFTTDEHHLIEEIEKLEQVKDIVKQHTELWIKHEEKEEEEITDEWIWNRVYNDRQEDTSWYLGVVWDHANYIAENWSDEEEVRWARIERDAVEVILKERGALDEIKPDKE